MQSDGDSKTNAFGAIVQTLQARDENGGNVCMVQVTEPTSEGMRCPEEELQQRRHNNVY